MAIHRTARIPFNRIIKIGVWSNIGIKSSLSRTYSKIRAKYPGKEVYIMNAGFFCMDRKMSLTPCWGMKANGTMYGNDWTGTGFMAFKGNQAKFFSQGSGFPSDMTDGFSGYPVLIENGRRSPYYHEWCDGKSNRGRSMIGFNKDYFIMSCISDTSGSSDFTIPEELNYMLGQGCQFAINCDGGGSSQCNFNGARISSCRTVSNFVYVVAEPAPDYSREYKKKAQRWLNANYNSGLAIDGSLGPASRKAMIKAMQKECGVAVDGSWGPNSRRHYKCLSVGTPLKNRVKILQCALMRKGYWNNELTGEYNNDLRNQVMLYQRAARLAVDGYAGPATITSLFK